jgi:hypothetical protein
MPSWQPSGPSGSRTFRRPRFRVAIPTHQTTFSGGARVARLLQGRRRHTPAWKTAIFGTDASAYQTVVDAASGKILYRHSLVNYASRLPGSLSGRPIGGAAVGQPDGVADSGRHAHGPEHQSIRTSTTTTWTTPRPRTFRPPTRPATSTTRSGVRDAVREQINSPCHGCSPARGTARSRRAPRPSPGRPPAARGA